MGIGLVDLSEHKYSKKLFNNIVRRDLSEKVLEYLNGFSTQYAKENGREEEYFSVIKNSFKQGIETNTVSVYESNGFIDIKFLPIFNNKVCEIVGSRQFHDAGDIAKIHEDGTIEYRVYSEANIVARTFDERKISNSRLKYLIDKINYVETLNNADQNKVMRDYASVNVGFR